MKKLIATLLVLTAVFALAACGSEPASAENAGMLFKNRYGIIEAAAPEHSSPLTGNGDFIYLNDVY